jgi:SHS2 domain-containing protein
MFELFDHTADLGLRIRAADPNALFAEAGRALFSVVVEDLATIQPRQPIEIVLPAEELDYLLFDWLKELLYRFDSEHLLLGRFEVQVHAGGLQGKAWGEPFDAARHSLQHEVKAITYHGLTVQQTDDGWLAEVILDI